MNTLQGRVAVVTGASAGIGRAIAEDLAGRGASVVLNARRKPELEKLAARLNDRNGRTCVAFACGDCADSVVIGAMLDAAESTFGKPPCLVVVNAGRGLAGSVMTSDAEQWEEMIRTNLLGAARLMRASGQRMAAAGEAEPWPTRPRDIVVVGSTVGRHISPFSSMYGATKFGVNSLAEAHRRELGPKGVRVTLVEPGIVASEFQAVAGYEEATFAELMDRISPVLSPEDVARAVGFVVDQPPGVHISDFVIRPTRQDYP